MRHSWLNKRSVLLSLIVNHTSLQLFYKFLETNKNKE